MLAISAPPPAVAARKLPDLRVATVKAPATAVPGQAITATVTVRNTGRAAARASRGAVLLSRDGRRSADDTEVARVAVRALKPRKAATARPSVTLPAASPAGRAFLLVCVDAAARVREVSERNNCRAVALSIVSPVLGASPQPPTLVPTPAPAPAPTPVPVPDSGAAPVPDTTPPAAPVFAPLTPAVGSDPTPTLRGTAEPGTTIRAFRSAFCDTTPATPTTSVGPDGSWSLDLPVTLNATTALSVDARDGAGNVSGCSDQRSYVHDDVAPAAPALTATSPVSPAPTRGPSVNGQHPEPDSVVRLYLTADCTGQPAATSTGTGPFSLAVTVPANTASAITARATDAAGNRSSCAGPLAYVHDDQGPAVPTLTGTDPVSPSRLSTTPTLQGVAEDGAVEVAIFRDEDCDETPLMTAVTVAGAFEAALNVSANSTTRYRVRSRDAGGNRSLCSAELAYVHDNVDPAAPVLDSILPASPGNDPTPDVRGTAEPGTTIRTYRTADCSGPADGTAVTPQAGTFSATSTASPNALATFRGQATDPAGNVGPCSGSSVAYLHDDVAPNVSLFLQPVPQSGSFGSEFPDVNDETPVLRGFAEAGSTVTVRDGGCAGAVRATLSPQEWDTGVELAVENGSTTIFAAEAVDAAQNRTCVTRTYREVLDVDEDGDAPVPTVTGTLAVQGDAEGQPFDTDAITFAVDRPMLVRTRPQYPTGISCLSYDVSWSPAAIRRVVDNAFIGSETRPSGCYQSDFAYEPGEYRMAFGARQAYLERIVMTPFGVVHDDTGPDTPAAAGALATGTVPVQGILAGSKDVDHVRTPLVSGGRLVVAASSLLGTCPEGTAVELDLVTVDGDPIAAGTGAPCERLDVTATETGAAVVRVTTRSADDVPYLLDVRRLPGDALLEVEPNATADTAAAEGRPLIEDGVRIAGSQHYATDRDVFVRPAGREAVLHLELSGADGRCGGSPRTASMTVTLPAGQRSSPSSLGVDCSGLTATFPATQTTVEVFQGTQVGIVAPNAYELTTTLLPAREVDGETPLEVPGYVERDLAAPEQIDRVYVDIAEGGAVRATVLPDPGSAVSPCAFTEGVLQPRLRLLAPDGTIRSEQTFVAGCPAIAGFAGAGSQAAARGLPAGRYALEVSTASTGGERMPYRLAVLTR